MNKEPPLLSFIPSHDNLSIPMFHWPHEKPKAIIQMIHGLSEHSLRYNDMAIFFQNFDIAFYGHDHRGHGRHEGLKGFVASQHGWDKLLEDICLVTKEIHKTYKNVPIFLLGHSMGSFLAQHVFFKYPFSYKGLILSGSTYQHPWVTSFLKKIVQCEKWRLGQKGISILSDYFTFNYFNKFFAPNRTKADWLSSDPETVDAFLQDPLCGSPVTLELWWNILEGLEQIYTPQKEISLSPSTPIFLVGGAKDPLGGQKGIANLERWLKRLGFRDVLSSVFPEGRHEILLEKNKKDVYEQLLQWISAKI